MDRKDLMEAVLEQIIDDCRIGDYMAIYELLDRIPEDALAGFIPEEKLAQLIEN